MKSTDVIHYSAVRACQKKGFKAYCLLSNTVSYFGFIDIYSDVGFVVLSR